MINNNNFFIKIPNQLITEGEGNIFHLDSKELYVYSFLYINKRMDGNLIMSLSCMHDFIPIKISKQKDRNVKALKDVLSNLIEKGIVKIKSSNNEDADMSNVKSSDSLLFHFENLEEEGHGQIPYEIFYKIESLIEYYIYVAVKRWENLTKTQGIFTCSYDRFARILKVSTPTAIKSIEKSIKNGLIFKNVGAYKDKDEVKDERLQDVNQYKTTPFLEYQKTNMTLKYEKDSDYSSEDVYLEAKGEMYYSHEDLEYCFNQWNLFEDELTGEQLHPPMEAHLIGLLVEHFLAKRNPTEMEEKVMDKIKWRTKLMLKTPKGEQLWEKEHLEAKYHFENILLEEQDIGS